ncbi:unnamed protein product [Porites evermanni]|uniref:Reverse transcriptase domain-containing protein n=1 Tax=Porites evermanni TaxID=104178 RepID=A0ABN8RBD5_9CNID|nr:unnamed protein product [Porites evermanni]
MRLNKAFPTPRLGTWVDGKLTLSKSMRNTCVRLNQGAKCIKRGSPCPSGTEACCDKFSCWRRNRRCCCPKPETTTEPTTERTTELTIMPTTAPKDWRNIIDRREAVGALAVDFSKAFDARNHRLLPAKLKT